MHIIDRLRQYQGSRTLADIGQINEVPISLALPICFSVANIKIRPYQGKIKEPSESLRTRLLFEIPSKLLI